MRGRDPARVPAAPDRALDLRGQLQQQAIVGLAGLRLDAQRQAVVLRGQRQRDAGDAAQVGQRRVGKVAPQFVEPIEHRRVVAEGQVLQGAELGCGQRGDRRQDDVPGLEELTEGARGGVEDALHLRPLGVAGLQAGLPDLDVDRLDQLGRRPRQTRRREQAGDGLRKVADVAGGLGGEGRSKVDRWQGPFDMVAQPFQKAADALELGHVVRHRAVVAPLVRQRDAQPPWVALDQLAIGLGRHPVRHELARCAAAAVVNKRGGVAHASALATLGRDEPAQV